MQSVCGGAHSRTGVVGHQEGSGARGSPSLGLAEFPAATAAPSAAVTAAARSKQAWRSTLSRTRPTLQSCCSSSVHDNTSSGSWAAAVPVLWPSIVAAAGGRAEAATQQTVHLGARMLIGSSSSSSDTSNSSSSWGCGTNLPCASPLSFSRVVPDCRQAAAVVVSGCLRNRVNAAVACQQVCRPCSSRVVSGYNIGAGSSHGIANAVGASSLPGPCSFS
jgi:hypothetical protein